MPLNKRPPFRIVETYVSRKRFTFDDREFVPGQPFPWRELDCSERKLEALYSGHFINLPEQNPTLETRLIAPSMRKFAAENDIDLDQVIGTGKGGSITKADIQKVIDARDPVEA